jgi:hypothetical protein
MHLVHAWGPTTQESPLEVISWSWEIMHFGQVLNFYRLTQII